MLSKSVKVRATKTEHIQVDVAAYTIFEEVIDLAKNTIIPEGCPSDSYIKDGRGQRLHV